MSFYQQDKEQYLWPTKGDIELSEEDALKNIETYFRNITEFEYHDLARPIGCVRQISDVVIVDDSYVDYEASIYGGESFYTLEAVKEWAAKAELERQSVEREQRASNEEFDDGDDWIIETMEGIFEELKPEGCESPFTTFPNLRIK